MGPGNSKKETPRNMLSLISSNVWFMVYKGNEKRNAKIMSSAGENPECLKEVLNCKTQENLGE